MTDLAAVKVLVYGHVQGVFFRAFASQYARGLGLTGYVHNLPDGSVDVRAEGEKEQLDKLIEHLRAGPPGARVEKLVTGWSEYSGSYTGFQVTH
ncbi:MAG: acylphosphatase [Chloroflexi bacterium]|nr:acylphosphatase [Chloroflexota bacterium]